MIAAPVRLLRQGEDRLLIPKAQRRNNFDIIRLMLAIAVLYSHSYYIYYGASAKEKEPLELLTMNQVDLGGIAVDCFFIISGFLIANSYCQSSNLRSYLRKRVLRICPGFIVAFLLSVLVFAPLGNFDIQNKIFYFNAYFYSLPLKRILLQLILFKDPYPLHCFKGLPGADVINGSLWTIQFELICYFMVPAIALAGMIKRKWLTVVLFLLSYTVFALQFRGYFYYENYHGKQYLDVNNFPRLFTYFLSGVCVYLYKEVIPRSRIILVLAVYALLFGCVKNKSFDLMFPIAGTYLLFYLAYSTKIQFYDFAKRGDISYGVYLYAYPIQQLVMFFLWNHMSPNRIFMVALPITMIIAYFWSWKCVEKRFIQLK